MIDWAFVTPDKAQSYLQKFGWRAKTWSKATLRWVYVCIFFLHLRKGLHLSDEETRARYAPKTSHCEDESTLSTALPQSHWEKTVWDTQFPGRLRLASYSSFQDLTRRTSPPPTLCLNTHTHSSTVCLWAQVFAQDTSISSNLWKTNDNFLLRSKHSQTQVFLFAGKSIVYHFSLTGMVNHSHINYTSKTGNMDPFPNSMSFKT